MKNQIGYNGKITLVSPSGSESVELSVPGRNVDYRGNLQLNGRYYGGYGQTGVSERQDRRLRRLLSQGWKISATKERSVLVDTDSQIREEEKKNTDVVIGTTKTGNLSHGGDHASGEVKDSPNAAKQGKNFRGCRGGQKHRRKQNRNYGSSKSRARVQVQKCAQVGSGAVYAPQPLKITPAMMASAKKSADLLAKLVGRSPLKIKSGITVNAEKFLVALEIGDNPLPPLEVQDERPKLKILVTPDCSGSCQGWSGLGQAWSTYLSRMPDVDVIYLTNANGDFWEVREETEWQKLIQKVDVVLYLGDGDGHEMCTKCASLGATVVALDCYAACVAKPRLKKTKSGKGMVFWVDRVSAKDSETWEKALSLCLKP